MAFTRRAALFGAGAVTGAAAMRWLGPRAPVLTGAGVVPAIASGDTLMNDASLLSPTPVARHVVLGEDPGEALVTRLRAELAEAAADGRPVNIGAARHSMGAQAIPRDGHAITLDSRFIEPDTSAGTFRCHPGIRWSQVIASLDALGFSPKVMQSNNDFGVAATFSVNAHGWPVTHGPMGATVQEITLLLPDGSLVPCSRTQEPGLFRAAMGGYGLIGLVTDMVVEMAPNALLTPTFEHCPAADFAARFTARLGQPEVQMAYGRLNVDRARFFEDALIVGYTPSDSDVAPPPVTGSGFLSKASRPIFRAQVGNEAMKSLRWFTETSVGPRLAGEASRNALLNEPVITLDDRDPSRTDILHEYFVSPDRFPEFCRLCRDVIPSSYQELLNVTLRFVDADPDSVLSYAPVPRIAAVLLFSQEMTPRGEADMARMTRALIDGVLALGGTYYLPYRPHASVTQIADGYPRAPEFVALKRRLDPGSVLRNGLWDNYLVRL
jgi:FAD/FMN-containing dehydrogenase